MLYCEVLSRHYCRKVHGMGCADPPVSQSVKPASQPSSWVGPSNAKSLLTTRSNCPPWPSRRGAGAIGTVRSSLTESRCTKLWWVGCTYVVEQPVGPVHSSDPCQSVGTQVRLPRTLKKLLSRELAQSSRQ